MTVPFPRERRDQCAWIEDDPTRCCGKYVPPDRTYAFCDEHMARIVRLEFKEIDKP